MKALWSMLWRFFIKLSAFSLAVGYLLAPFALISAALPAPAFAQINPNPQPTCFINVKPSSINVGGSATVTWTSTNATVGAITNIGNVGPSGSINLLPSNLGPTTYYGAFTGPGGTANCQATVGLNTAIGSPSATTQTIDPTTGLPVTTSSPLPPANSGTAGGTGSGGLVPCGSLGFVAGSPSHDTSTGCEACDLATLIQNIINFAIGISIPIAAALFAWAGVLFFTAADNTSKLTQAKQIFKNAFIGFLIAICAWIIINTLLTVLFSSSSTITPGSWFTIQCAPEQTRPTSTTINQILGQLPSTNNLSTNGTPTAATPGSSVAPNCPSGFSLQTYSDGSYNCVDASGENIATPTCTAGYTINSNYQCIANSPTGTGAQCPYGSTYYPGSNSDGTIATCYNDTTGDVSLPIGGASGGARGVAQCTSDNDICSVSALTSDGLTTAQANAMSCIAITENSGQAAGCSGTGPCGAFQISQTNWQQYAPSQCSASNFGGSITAAQNNGTCNQLTMVAMVQAQGYQPWTGNNNGVYWNPAARTCVANYDPSNLH